jgi:hypothetical protein
MNPEENTAVIMNRRHAWILIAVLLFGRIAALADTAPRRDQFAAPSVVINEIKAVNRMGLSTLVEGKTAYPDWIELHNRGATPVNLSGWYLTDSRNNLTKWPVPAVQIAPGGFLVVFASGIEEQDHPTNWPYRDQAGNYHTNFKLSSQGEYLALVGPDQQVMHEYGSHLHGGGFPAQRADLSYGLYGDELQYFTTPTPGRANGPGYASISDEPIFSHEGGTFTGLFFLELSSPNPEAEIRFTIDGQIPTLASPLYTNPYPVFGTREILARAYEPGKAPSTVVSRTYVALTNDVLNFNSNLPIVIVDTLRRSTGTTLARASCVLIDTGEQGRTGIVDPAVFEGRVGIRRRGSSTRNAAKPSYAVEIWDEDNEDRDVSLLGMPANSDWVLYAPFQFDRALINNAFVYDLSNQIGRYAVRTRFVEMFLNTNDDTVSSSDYVGLYILMERIKQGEERVDVDKLYPWDSTEPKITGGYMLKIDRLGPGDRGFRTARGNPSFGGGTFCYVNPKEVNITAAQSNWIRGYLNAFEDALYGPAFADPHVGYAKYIDVDSFIDHNLINMLAMNVDALRLSTHLFKPRGGKLQMGPIWDFDRALDSTDGRDDNPRSWRGTGDATDYHRFVWWNRLFEDSNFWQKYIDRWYVLRQGPFSTAGLNATIDAMAAEIWEAQVRNFQRWSGQGPRFGGYQGEINHLKQWLQTRCTWVDGQFVAPPLIFPEGGRIEAGSVVHLVNPHAGGKLYYTLDGSDPRPSGVAPVLSNVTTLVAENAFKRVLVPAGPIPDAWRSDLAFNDSTWLMGTGGVGYERSTGYENYFTIDVGNQMFGGNTSCYIRVPFAVPGDPRAFNVLTLRMRYDDGFVAYLNGVEITRALFTGTPAWNSRADGNHDDSTAVLLQEFDVSAHAGLLRQGLNLLAVQGMNSSPTSSDLLFSFELVAGRSVLPEDDDQSGAVHEYAGPITITESTQIKARVVVPSNPYSPWSGLAQAIFMVGPGPESVRINEIMYHPPGSGRAEYVELLNIADSAITLYDAIRGLPWRFTDNPENPTIDFSFPSDPPVTLAPGERLLLVRDLEAFHEAHGAPPDVQILEWGPGRLVNSSDTIQLTSPGDVNFDGTRSWIVADRVTYSDGSHPELFADGFDPWPPEADGRGMALGRIDPEADGDDFTNWLAVPPSPGVAK